MFKEFGFAGFLEQFFGSHQGGQMFGDSVQRRGPGVRCAVLLRQLDFFPVGPDLVHIFHLDVAKDVRMAAHEFVGEMPRDVFEVKRAALARQLAMEHDLKKQVAQFFRHLVIVAGFDGVEQFIDFLDGVKAERAMILFAVPGAALRRAQLGRDLQ